MPYHFFLGIFTLKLILSLGLPSVVSANESFDICEIKRNYKTYTNTSRSNYTGLVTQAGEMACTQVDPYTYQVSINGRTRFVHRSAIISKRPQTLAVQLSLRPVARPKTVESPAVILPTSINDSLRPASSSSELDPAGQRIQNGFIGSTTDALAPRITISSKNAPEISGGGIDTIIDSNLTPEEERLTRSTRLLKSSGWVTPRSEPNRESGFECSVVTDGSCSKAKDQVSTIDHNVELSPTGERTYDEDNREWYFKANFEHGDQTYSAWFAEEQTEIDPDAARIREQTAQRTQDWLKGGTGSIYGPNSEVADSESEPYQISMKAADIAARLQATVYDPNVTYETSDRAASEREMAEAQQMFPNSTTRGRKHLMRLHPGGEGLCGSTANNTSNPSTKSYTAPITACALARLTQTWRERFCTNNNSSCQLAFGNVSHPELEKFGRPRHQTHTHGNCVDIRPIRDSGNQPVEWSHGNYNRSQTRNLLNLLKEMGAESVYFNDPQMISDGLSSRMGGHDNHIHFCFRSDNAKAEKQCAEFEPDARICPTTDVLFNHPTMIDFRNGLTE